MSEPTVSQDGQEFTLTILADGRVIPANRVEEEECQQD